MIYIEKLDHYDPDEFYSSEKLEEDLKDLYDRLSLPFGRLELLTSIKTRGIYTKGTMPSTIATRASHKLLGHDEELKNQIDLLIYAGVSRDFLEPSTASVVHANLGLKPQCAFFDLSNACVGFLQAIKFASQLIKSGSHQKILIVTGENATPLIDTTIKTLNTDERLTRKTIKPYFANLTIGSAGVAAIIGREVKGFRLLGGSSLSDSSKNHLCRGGGDMNALTMETNSEELLYAGVELAFKLYPKFLKDLNLGKSFDRIITHQVGIRHRDFLYEKLGLDKSLDFSSFEYYGNTGSAALPLTLSLALKNKVLKSGDIVSLLGIGSGLHSIMMGVEVV